MANYFWILGSGTWDNVNTANWSTSSGGTGGAGPPTSADTVTIDSLSGSGTITTAATAAAANITLNSSTLTLTLGANLTISGLFTHTLGTLNLSGGFQLTAATHSSNNSNVRVIAFGASGSIRITGSGTTIFNLPNISNFSYTGTSLVIIDNNSATAATVNAGAPAEAQTLNVRYVSGTYTLTDTNSFYQSVDFTGFAGTLANAARRVYGSFTASSGMTLSAGTALTSFRGTSRTNTITTAGKTLDFPVDFNGTGSTFAFADAVTQGSSRAFTLTNGTVKLKNGVTSTVGAFATSGGNAKALQSTVDGSQATLSQASGTVSVSNLTIKDIAATGGAAWQAYLTNNNVNGGNNSGWQFLTPAQLAANSGLSMRIGLGL